MRDSHHHVERSVNGWRSIVYCKASLRLSLCLSWRKPSTNQHEVLPNTLVYWKSW